MKYKKHLEELHNDMPEEVLQVLYAREETEELRKILEKFRQCKNPDEYTLISIRVVEDELKKRLQGEGKNG